MSDVAWEIEHSVETSASPAFAWTYMSNVANWDDPPAEFKLDGPFAVGSHGITQMPGQDPRHWQLREVTPMRCYTTELPLDRASMLFEWQFNPLPDGRTQLTQHVVLKGENATAYLAQVQLAFTSNLAPGMNKIAAAIGRAEAKTNDAG
ncbi:MAG: SRPBCC family protein [Nitrospirota bacterium]|nr:SRPBCC family protein [Nitrospirota bacterium]